MLDREYQFYKENEVDFKEKYDGKFIVVVGAEVVGVYDSNREAYQEAMKKFALGTFLIQHVSRDEQINIQQFYSPVYGQQY